MKQTRSDIPSNWRWNDQALAPGPTVVFDIDGVLANADDRQHFIDKPSRKDCDWKSFFRACSNDTVIEETGRLLELLGPDIRVVLLTGRPTDIQDITVDWFERNGLRWDLLIMRDIGDYHAALVFKQQAVRQLKAMGFDPRLAFEDDEKNREMFQGEGVPCMYIYSGYYDKRDQAARA